MIRLAVLVGELALIYVVIRKYLRSDYSRILIILLIALIANLVSNGLSFSAIFIPEPDRDLFHNIRTLDFLSTILSLYFFLLIFEFFEYETLLTQGQLIGTVLTTVTTIFIVYTIPQANWLINEQMYFQSLDSPILVFLNLFGSILGAFVITTLRRGLKDVWITQREQIISMIASVCIISFIPFLFSLLLLFFSDQVFLIAEPLSRGAILAGYIILTISFGGTNHYSQYNRRKADKVLVTNLSGIPLFHYDFKENVHYINETLFSGAVVAITMLMSESIKSPSPIAEVLMKNKYRLMLETRESFIALILTPQANPYLRNSIERFARAFDQKFTSIITSGEVLDLNLFVKSGLGLLFENFGISTVKVKRMAAILTFEETIT